MADKLANRVTCYAGGSDEGSGHIKDPDSLLNTDSISKYKIKILINHAYYQINENIRIKKNPKGFGGLHQVHINYCTLLFRRHSNLLSQLMEFPAWKLMQFPTTLNVNL